MTEPTNALVELMPAQTQALARKAESLKETIHELEVVDETTLTQMNQLRVETQTLLKAVEDRRKEHLAPLLEQERGIRNLYRPLSEDLALAKSESGSKISRFTAGVEAKRREEQAKLEAEERKRREESIARMRETAEAEEKSGHTDTAASMRDHAREMARAPISRPAPATQAPSPEATRGTYMRKTWKALYDEDELRLRMAKAVNTWNAAHPDEPILGPEYWSLNDAMLQDFAKASKGAIKLPGVRFECDATPVTRGR